MRPAGWPGGPNLLPLQISSVLRARYSDSYLQRFLSLQKSFLCCAFVIVLGGGCFLLTALHLERDQAEAQQPGTGTSTPHTHARSGLSPLGIRNTGHPSVPGQFIHLFVHSFIQK